MHEVMNLKIVTPKGSRFDEPVQSFTACSELGEFCLLPNHRPILSSLIPGRMAAVRADGTKLIFALNGGFLQGGPDYVNVITEDCATAEELQPAPLNDEQSVLEQQLEAHIEENTERRTLEQELLWVRAKLAVVLENQKEKG